MVLPAWVEGLISAIFSDKVIAIATPVALALGAVFVSWLIHAVAFRILERVQRISFGQFMQCWLPSLRNPAQWLLTCFFLRIALEFMDMPPLWHARLHYLLIALIVGNIGWGLTSFTLATSEWLSQRYRWDGAADNLKYRSIHTQLRVFTHVIVFCIGLLTFIAIIMTFPHLRTIGMSLFASAGAAGIVLGLAAGPALSNLIAGIQLAVTQPIRIDDQIVVDKVSGVVEEIDSTYVVVRLWDLRRLIVPLNYFIQNRFQNWTHISNISVIATVTFYVDQNASIEAVRAELKDIVKGHPAWDGKTCHLVVTDLKDSKMVELQASFSTSYARNIYILQCDVREKLLLYIQRENNAAA